MLIDSHCHLNDEAFNEDLDVVLDNMVEHHINKAMIVSLNKEDLNKALNIKKEGIDFKYSIGVFPCDVNNMNEETFKEFEELMKNDYISAIGEIGLDYHYEDTNKDLQHYYLNKQLKIAQDLNKPVIIHSRDASQDTYDILSKYKCKGVIHCFSGSWEMAKRYIKLGYYICLSGVVTFKNAVSIKEVAQNIPLDKLLIETDSPYLAPTPNRGKRNEPSYVRLVADEICKLKNISRNELEEAVSNNYDNLFNI